MAKYAEKKQQPVVDAIQADWGLNSVVVKSGDWIIRYPDGSTGICGDDWFHKHYTAAD